MVDGFVELHARTAFSFLRGGSTPEEWAAAMADHGMDVFAVVDHRGFQGSARVHEAAREAGLRAVVGTTLELADPHSGAGGSLVHLPVLCAKRSGYTALCRFLSDHALASGATGPGALLDRLQCAPGDLIALTGDREGPLARRLLENDRAGALQVARLLVGIFGRDHVWVELTRHRLRDDARLNRMLVDLASHLRLGVVASNAPLHATRQGRMLADAFTCLRHHTTFDRAGQLLAANSERHLKTPRAMAELFRDVPEAVHNTRRIAERCVFTLEDLGYRFPDWHDDSGHPLSMPEQTTLLRRLAYAGAAMRHGRHDAAVKRQLEHELALIHKLGFSGYFLIVHDIVAFARGRGILCQGRGSAANSAVCHALGITHVDPVGSGLLFERFLSENRRSWPDIDIDFPSGGRREEVIQYVFRKYGPRGAAMTANVITCQPKSALREMTKVLGLPSSIADRFARTRILPWEEAGGQPSGPAISHSPNGPLATLYRAALGMPRHLGQHPGGMIIRDTGLDTIVPLQAAAMPGRHIVQWDKEDCENLGIVKVDLLGLGMLAAMETTLELCERRGRPVDPARIPKDDPAVFDLLCRADTIGTFQVESRAQMATLPLMRPQTFYDVAIQVAIIRPGPIVGDLVHPYLNRRNGREPVDFIHPSLEPVLARTLGVPLFQEQVLRIAMILAGFNGAEADELRRAMGSSRSSERMQRMTATLRARMSAKGVAAAAQDKVIRAIGSFALYGFPESHAISFALIAYASCWLKAHRTAEFYAGLINHQPMGFYSVHTLIQDAKRHGLRVLPVSCLHSAAVTTVEDDHTLRLGLHRLKGLDARTAERIVLERGRGVFRSLADFLLRVQPNAGERRLLAASGALNGLPGASHRREALWHAEAPLHDDLLGRALRDDPAPPPCAPLAPMTAEARLRADLATQGASIGPHPMKLWRDQHRAAGKSSPSPYHSRDLDHLRHGDTVLIGGLAICRQRPSTAKGHCFISLEDEFGIANLFVPKAVFERDRLILGTEAFLLARGVLQTTAGGKPTVCVSSLEALPGMEGHAAPASHDFH